MSFRRAYMELAECVGSAGIVNVFWAMPWFTSFDLK